jgi:hypothetical protein
MPTSRIRKGSFLSHSSDAENASAPIESVSELDERIVSSQTSEPLGENDRPGEVSQAEVFGTDIDAYEAAMDQTVERNRREDALDEPAFFPLRVSFNPPESIVREMLPLRLAEWSEAVSVISRGTFDVAVMETLSIINLVVQAHGDVEMWDQRRPLTLFTLIATRSGSKKSSMYRRLVIPVHNFVAGLMRDQAKRSQDTRSEGDAESTPKINPSILVQDTTAASLLCDLPKSRGYMGLCLDEASVFLGSYAMQRDNFLAMIGLFSKLHDGSPIAVNRKGSGNALIDMKRFSVLLASPMRPFISLLGNPMVREQGFISRALINAPSSERRPKASPEERAAARETLKSYDEFITKALSRDLPLAPGTINDLDPPLLTLTLEAEAVIDAFCEEILNMREALSEDDPTHDVVNKHAELAGRIAGTFALLENLDARVIDADTARQGVAFARHCMRESIRLVSPVAPSPHVDLAESIARWMVKSGKLSISRSELQSASLGRKYTVAEFDPALRLLIDSGWLIQETVKRESGGRAKRIYTLTRAAQRELAPSIAQ